MKSAMRCSGSSDPIAPSTRACAGKRHGCPSSATLFLRRLAIWIAGRFVAAAAELAADLDMDSHHGRQFMKFRPRRVALSIAAAAVLASVALLLPFSASGQSVPPDFLCGFAGVRTPFKIGSDTVTFNQSVQCVGPVRSIELNLELFVRPNGASSPVRVDADSLPPGTPPRVVTQSPYFSENNLELFHVPCFNGDYFAKLDARVTLLDGSTIGGSGTTQLAFVGNCPGNPTTPPPDVPPPPPLPTTPTPGPMFPDQPTTSPTQVIDMIRGKTLADAIIILMNRGFRLGTQTTQANANVPVNSVITGTLQSGTTNVIDVVLSAGGFTFKGETFLGCATAANAEGLQRCTLLRGTPCNQGDSVKCRVPGDADFCDFEDHPARSTAIKRLTCSP
jgi:hypothetical protein